MDFLAHFWLSITCLMLMGEMVCQVKFYYFPDHRQVSDMNIKGLCICSLVIAMNHCQGHLFSACSLPWTSTEVVRSTRKWSFPPSQNHTLLSLNSCLSCFPPMGSTAYTALCTPLEKKVQNVLAGRRTPVTPCFLFYSWIYKVGFISYCFLLSEFISPACLLFQLT